MAKTAVLEPVDSLKLISRKILHGTAFSCLQQKLAKIGKTGLHLEQNLKLSEKKRGCCL